jgi:hypothetical protein
MYIMYIMYTMSCYDVEISFFFINKYIYILPQFFAPFLFFSALYLKCMAY